MNSFFVKMPKFVTWLFPKQIWAFHHSKDAIYLTFDDGPIPNVTPWVLEELKKFQAKATFFCIGNNIALNNPIFEDIITEGHSIGNHTFDHLNGWKTKSLDYMDNIEKTQDLINNHKTSNSKPLFRPPFGKITPTQSKRIQKQGYQIIMWDVLSRDFDPAISKEKCLQLVLKNMKPGSIIVFHDSLKAETKLRYILPKVLEYVSDRGWKCKGISLH